VLFPDSCRFHLIDCLEVNSPNTPERMTFEARPSGNVCRLVIRPALGSIRVRAQKLTPQSVDSFLFVDIRPRFTRQSDQNSLNYALIFPRTARLIKASLRSRPNGVNGFQRMPGVKLQRSRMLAKSEF